MMYDNNLETTASNVNKKIQSNYVHRSLKT